jgi:hypothetical protein
MRLIISYLVVLVGVGLLLPERALSQGRGSAGVHLDIVANRTSTHGAVADVPGSPVYPLVPFAGAGLAGNPYQAYGLYPSTFTLRVTVAESLLGAAPFGSGSPITILYGIDVPANIFIPTPFGFVPPKDPALPLVISILPIGGVVVDGLSLVMPPPPPFMPVPADPGHPHKLEVPLVIPPVELGLHTFTFQAVVGTPFGYALSNGVSLKEAINPNETSVFLTMVGCGGGLSPVDEGNASVPVPPGFLFYGVPPGSAWMNTNGFVWFSLTLLPPGICSDFTGTVGDFGGLCVAPTATAAPRVDVNHFDVDLGASGPPLPFVGDFTYESGPPGISAEPGFPPIAWPSRTIIRWKNVRRFGSPVLGPAAPDTDYASMVCELWGADAALMPGLTSNAIIVVRQDSHLVTTQATTGSLQEQIGIGPGTAAQGFGGPPPACIALTLWSDSYAAPFCAGIADTMYMDNLLNSHILSNLAVRFRPGPAVGSYCVRVF